MSWHKYWLIWFLVTFGVGFLPVEIYCLVKGNGGTLSEAIWWLEGYRRGDVDFANIAKWSVGHLIFSGILTLILAWLIGHFDFRIWR